MIAMEWQNRKRGRDDTVDEYESNPLGFEEHRTKRIATLPHRQSSNIHRQPTPPTFNFGTSCSTLPDPPTITPADSENEETPRTAEPKSFFSPYSSSPGGTMVQSSPSSPTMEILESSQSTQTSDVQMYSDDMDMDAMHFSPTPSQQSPSVSGRIPTPIHSSFAPFIRAEKASLHDVDFADDEALVNRFRRPRRLPSPISEGEMSPSVLVDGLGDMQMEIDAKSSQSEHETSTTPKKGHQRSKHSLRQWSGVGGDLSSAGAGVKRSFSLGYRADCEKCRLKVPGHFSHIITY